MAAPEPTISSVREAMAWREAYIRAETWAEKEYIYDLWARWERNINGEVGAYLRSLLAEFYPNHDAAHLHESCAGHVH